jgi:ligand-binding SRPBCC domain-containing protein
MEIKKLFIATSGIDAPAAEVFHWHEEAGALERLTPPWEAVELEQPPPGIRDGDRGVLRVGLGPLKIRWVWSIATISKVASFATFRFQVLFVVGSTPTPSGQMVRMRVF